MTDELPPDGRRESDSTGGGVARRRPKDRMAKGGVRDPALRTGLPRLWAQLTSWLLAYLPGRHRPRLPRVHIHTAPAIPSVVLLVQHVCRKLPVTSTRALWRSCSANTKHCLLS